MIEDWHDPLGEIGSPQVLLCANSTASVPVSVYELIVNGAVPVLVIVMIFAADVVPTVCVWNVRFRGETEA